MYRSLYIETALLIDKYANRESSETKHNKYEHSLREREQKETEIESDGEGDRERVRARHKTGAKQEQPYILCVPTGDDESFWRRRRRLR